jgi:hypothetical protein
MAKGRGRQKAGTVPVDYCGSGMASGMSELGTAMELDPETELEIEVALQLEKEEDRRTPFQLSVPRCYGRGKSLADITLPRLPKALEGMISSPHVDSCVSIFWFLGLVSNPHVHCSVNSGLRIGKPSHVYFYTWFEPRVGCASLQTMCKNKHDKITFL